MIHTIRTVAVGDQESKIDSPIILYRGDREVEVEFTINGSKFTFTNGGNVIKSMNATHGQLVINTPTGENMFSEVTECHDGKVVFVITKEMIDELIEVGFYSFQIRLFDESQVSRVTIPPVLKGIDIRNPIAAEDETNVVDIALVDYAVVVKDEFENLSTFLPDGNYNKTEWESKDAISGARLNKIEDALYNINSNMEATDLALLNRIERISNDGVGNRLDALEEVNADSRLDALEDVNADSRLDALEDVNADSRLDALEDVNADSRLDALESVNADSRLDALESVNADSRLDNLERSMTNDINIQNYSHLVENGDWTIAINTALNDCEDSNSNLYFPNGTYTVSETINLRHKVSMLGQSRLNTVITSRGCTIFNLEGDSILNPNGRGHIQQCNIKNMAIHGPSLQVPSLTAKACSRTSFENVFFYSNNKTMITGVEFFDIRWTDCLFEWAGTSDGSYPMIDFIWEDGYEFNNNHYFYGCLFESYRGMVIRNVCENSTEFKFTNCKFESSFSNSRQFEFENVGVIHFNNCMVSAQGNDVNATVKDIMSFKNCYDIKLDISLYKWDNVNGNRSSYYIPDNLITIDSCYCFDCNIRIFNNTIRLKNDNDPYVKLINAPSDGSDIRVIKRPGDAHIGVRWFTHSMCNNINIKNDSEPCVSLTNANNVTYQLGRITNNNDFRIIRYDSSGNESTPFEITNNGCSINQTLFLFEATHLAKLSDDSKVPWWDNGTIYYNTTTNTLRVYINGAWKNITTN